MNQPVNMPSAESSMRRVWTLAPPEELIRHIIDVHHCRTRVLLAQMATTVYRLTVFPASEGHQRFLTIFRRFSQEILRHLDQEERYLFPACARCADPLHAHDAESHKSSIQALHSIAMGHNTARMEIAHLQLLASELGVGNKPQTSASLMRMLSDLDVDLVEHGRLEESILIPMVIAPHVGRGTQGCIANDWEARAPADGHAGCNPSSLEEYQDHLGVPAYESPNRAMSDDENPLSSSPGCSQNPASSDDLVRPYPSEYIIPAELKDGTRITIRPVRRSDADRMTWFLNHLQTHPDGYSYFGGVSSSIGFSSDRFIHVCFADYSRELVVLAERLGNETSEILGMGRLSRDLVLNQAELTVVVSDTERHHWLGTQLVCGLIDIGRREQFDKLVTRLMPNNDDLQHLYQLHGFQFCADPVAGQILGELEYHHRTQA